MPPATLPSSPASTARSRGGPSAATPTDWRRDGRPRRPARRRRRDDRRPGRAGAHVRRRRPARHGSTAGPWARRRASTSAPTGRSCWRPRTGRCACWTRPTAPSATLDRPQGDVSDVSLAPDDDLVATGVSVQKAAEAWDDTIEATSWRRHLDFTLGGQAEDVTGCSFYEAMCVFSPDGSLLASSSHDFTVQITPLADPDATTMLEPHVGSVLDIAVLARRHDARHVGRRRLAADVGRRRLDLLGESPPPARRLVLAGIRPRRFARSRPPTRRRDLAARSGDRCGHSLVHRRAGEPRRHGVHARRPAARGAGTRRHRRHLVGRRPAPSNGLRRPHACPSTRSPSAADGSTVVTSSQDGTVRSWPLPPAVRPARPAPASVSHHRSPGTCIVSRPGARRR